MSGPEPRRVIHEKAIVETNELQNRADRPSAQLPECRGRADCILRPCQPNENGGLCDDPVQKGRNKW